MKYASCHPDQKHRAKGLCGKCYYRANAARCLASCKKWKHSHPEKVKKSKAKWRQNNRDKARISTKRWYTENIDKRRSYWRYKHYGISEQQYKQLLEQQHGVCAICEGLPSNNKALFVDHNHTTGKIRGLLCDLCNLAVGNFKDNPMLMQKGIDYLLRFDEIAQ